MRQTAAEEWQDLRTKHVLLRPFLAISLLLDHAFRWIYLMGCYLMLIFAWIVRFAVGVAVAAIALFAFEFYQWKTRPYTPPTNTRSDSSPQKLSESPPQESPNSNYQEPAYSNNTTATTSHYGGMSSLSHNYDTPSTSSSSHSSSYQPRVSGENLTKISTGVYNYASQQQMVDVSGYTRGDTYVQPYQRQPQGGIDNVEAGALALGAAVAIVGIDYASQKYDQWSAEREAAARRKAEERARKEQQELLDKWEAEERAREKEKKKKSWWNVDKKEEEAENPWSIFKKKSWWE